MTTTLKPTVQVLTSEVLRCHGFEKNLQAISLTGAESLRHALTETDPQILDLMPQDAQDYAKGQFSADYARYSELSAKIIAKNAGKGDLAPGELDEQVALRDTIRQHLTPTVVQAILQDSGLFSAQDFAANRVSVNEHGSVTLRDVSQVGEGQLKAARDYVEARQAVRQDDGSWRSHAANRQPASLAAGK